MAPENEFDIYQTEAGYAAVTNPVRRQILAALQERDQELPDLVKLTGKSKPTLSNLHMKELLSQKLIEELPHPTDSRRKVYRIKGRRIGSSNVPLDQLRGAVKQYVSLSPLAYSVPLPTVLTVLAAGGAAGKEGLRSQGVALGAASAHLFTPTGPRDLLTGLGAFLERENIVRVGKIDLDRLELEVEVAERFAGTPGDLDVSGVLLAGFLQGVLKARLGIGGGVSVKGAAGRRLTLALPSAD